MRKFLLVIVAATLSVWSALAEQPRGQTSYRAATPGKQLPLKRGATANSCTAFGADFVKVEGTDTCVKVGGYVSSGASAYMGAR